MNLWDSWLKPYRGKNLADPELRVTAIPSFYTSELSAILRQRNTKQPRVVQDGSKSVHTAAAEKGAAAGTGIDELLRGVIP